MIQKSLTGALVTLALMGAATFVAAQQEATAQSTPPQVEDLGNQRYRVGAIEIDKASGSFSVPGRVLRDEPPIEFLVATRGGYKSYESVLEADADAFEFNLACILIGLDAANAVNTGFEQSSRGLPLDGDRVDVTVSWIKDGKAVSVPGSRLLLQGDPPAAVQSDDWVYTGSEILPGGEFLPEISGTLLGVVRRNESLIEHRLGVMGDYGSVLVNKALLPGVGEPIELIIQKIKAPPIEDLH